MKLIEYILGPAYWSAKKLLSRSEFAAKDSLEILQYNFLRSLITYSKRHIPYYEKIEDVAGAATLGDVLESLKLIPIIDKKVISRNVDNFRGKPFLKGIKVNTGGSTGHPFVFYLERFVSREREKAFIFWQWSRIGYIPGDKIFNLRGTLPPESSFVRHDKIFNIYSASSLSLTASRIKTYVENINLLKPKYLQGYPSTIYLLASLVAEANLQLDFDLKGVFCGSEKLYPYQRNPSQGLNFPLAT